jgi:hypothetical protein
MAEATASPQPDPGGIQAAIDRYRDLAKYAVTIFAAVGGLLVAGTQLSTVGSLQWPQNEGRIIAGGAGFIVAIVAAGFIVWNVLNVLSPVEMSFEKVKEKVGDRKFTVPVELLRPYDSLDELALVIQVSDIGSSTHEALLDQAAEIVDKASYDEIASRFKVARLWMIGGAFLGTAGIVAFVWGVNPPKSETAEPVVRPVPQGVNVSLTHVGREVLAGSLGDRCDFERIDAITLGGTEDRPLVLALEENGCKLTQFSLPPNWGKATATRAAPVGSDGG